MLRQRFLFDTAGNERSLERCLAAGLCAPLLCSHTDALSSDLCPPTRWQQSFLASRAAASLEVRSDATILCATRESSDSEMAMLMISWV